MAWRRRDDSARTRGKILVSAQVDLKVLWIDVMEIVWVAILSATVNSAGGDDDDGEGPRVPWGEGRWAEPVVDEGGAVSR